MVEKMSAIRGGRVRSASKLVGDGADALLVSVVADDKKRVNHPRQPAEKREEETENKASFSPGQKDRERGKKNAEEEVHDDLEIRGRRFAGTLHPRPSTLKDQPVVFDDWVREQITAHFVELGLRLRAIELEFNEFSDPGAFDGRQAVMVNGVADRHPLRVEHALLWQHDDLGFHFAGQTMGGAAGFKRELAGPRRPAWRIELENRRWRGRARRSDSLMSVHSRASAVKIRTREGKANEGGKSQFLLPDQIAG